MLREGDVALEEKMIETSRNSWFVGRRGGKSRVIAKGVAHSQRTTTAHATQNFTAKIWSLVRVTQFSKSIWQPLKNRPKHRRQSVVQPFGQKINAAQFADADVGADVEEGVGVQGLSDKFELRMMEPHVAEGEGDEGDIRLAVMELEFEGDLRLEILRGDAVVQKHRRLPGAAKKRIRQR